MYEKDFPIYSLDFIKHNKHWISYYGYGGLSPYYAEDSTGLTIPNCVPFVYGYWHCMGDCKEPKELKLCPGNACYFYPYNDGYERSKTVPKIGAIACWEGGSDHYGHIAIVIWVSKDGKTIKTLNSAYKSTIYYERTLSYPFDFGKYHFQGFIYCPFVEPNPPVEHKTLDELAHEVLEGKWGNGKERVELLDGAFERGEIDFNYDQVQARVNEILHPADELKVGDKVEIIATGNGQANGKGKTAYGIGWTREILGIYDGAFPYRVGSGRGTTGFYKKEALKKL